MSLLDITMFDTQIRGSERAYLWHFRSSYSEGVQLGQVPIYCRVSTDDQSRERQERDLPGDGQRSCRQRTRSSTRSP